MLIQNIVNCVIAIIYQKNFNTLKTKLIFLNRRPGVLPVSPYTPTYTCGTFSCFGYIMNSGSFIHGGSLVISWFLILLEPLPSLCFTFAKCGTTLLLVSMDLTPCTTFLFLRNLTFSLSAVLFVFPFSNLLFNSLSDVFPHVHGDSLQQGRTKPFCTLFVGIAWGSILKLTEHVNPRV